MRLYRFGGGNESTDKLAQAAAAAEQVLGIHGVSVSSRPHRTFPNPWAESADIEAAGFAVTKTGGRYQFTVELPKPLTDDTASRFNELWTLN